MTIRQPQPEEGADGGLDRYRTYGPFYERYWSQLFSMTQADMAWLAEQMRARGTALDLTTLARGVIHARLRHGPESSSGPAPNGSMPSQVVRVWDPGAMWRVGDRAIVPVPTTQVGRSYAPALGEIRQVGDDHVIIQIDGVALPQVYAVGRTGEPQQWRDAYGSVPDPALLAHEIRSLADGKDTSSRIDLILWRFGETVVGRLLHALQADPDFVELEGLWYCVELAEPLQEAQLVALSRLLFTGPDQPLTVAELLTLLSPMSGFRTSERFGATLSLRSRPDLFKNVGTPSYPRWILAGPPPVPLVAQHAVFDPESYEVLCTAGEALSLQAAQRLWDVGLLHAALGPGVEADSVPEHPVEERPGRTSICPNVEEAPELPSDAPRRHSWWRWLPFKGRG